jgi:hypothetical protein
MDTGYLRNSSSPQQRLEERQVLARDDRPGVALVDACEAAVTMSSARIRVVKN